MLDSPLHNLTGLALVLKLRIRRREGGRAMFLKQRFKDGVKFVAPLVLSGTFSTDQPGAKFVGLALRSPDGAARTVQNEQRLFQTDL
jgi:hypothetical protein